MDWSQEERCGSWKRSSDLSKCLEVGWLVGRRQRFAQVGESLVVVGVDTRMRD